LLAHRRGRLAAGLLVVVLSSVVFVQGMKWVIGAVRPIDFARGASDFSFPSGHATLAAALYGALGWLFARGLK
jgi:undecaprenyl-diphosphatase